MDKTNPGRKNGSGRIMLWILLGLAVLTVIFLALLLPLLTASAPHEANIKIPAGATAENVKDSLEKHFGENYASKVMKFIKIRNTDFSQRHGAYTIDKGTNALTAARKLTSGAQTPVKITINGFRSLPLLINRISAKMEFPADSLKAAVEDSQLLEQYGLTPQNAMALFLDDTYEVYWNSSARDVIKKIGENYKRVWNADFTKKAEELGVTPAELTIIASITDEESNAKSEKGTIGRLYLNRLDKNMKLQADPTVRFAIGDFTIKRVTQKDLRFESPYNTYIYAGLPPGPIRTTSEATIKSILESQPNDFLYMCAKEDFSGTHNFASDYEEHLANAKRYQEALNQRGITR